MTASRPASTASSDAQLGLHLRAAVAVVRVRTARRCGTCRCGGRWCRTGCSTTRGRRGGRRRPRAAATTLAVPRALTSSKSSTRAGWMTPAVWTTSTVPVEAGEQRGEPVGPADVADDGVDAGRARPSSVGVVGRRDEGPDPARAGAYGPSARARWSTSARPSQPPAPVTTVTSGGSSRGRAPSAGPLGAVDEVAGVADGDGHHRAPAG